MCVFINTTGEDKYQIFKISELESVTKMPGVT